MGGLRVVTAEPRSWKVFAAPAAFLLAATIAILAVHWLVGGRGTSSRPATSVVRKPVERPVVRVYIVRAGDTLDVIARRTRVPAARIEKLNPGLRPTALFIGEKIRLR